MPFDPQAWDDTHQKFGNKDKRYAPGHEVAELIRKHDIKVSGSFPTIMVNDRDELSAEQVKDALAKLRHRIATEDCTYDESDWVGDKYYHCNWGICQREVLFDDPNAHLWPLSFLLEGRNAPCEVCRYCPMNGGERKRNPIAKCQAPSDSRKVGLSRETALQRCDEILASLSAPSENGIVNEPES